MLERQMHSAEKAHDTTLDDENMMRVTVKDAQ